MLNKERRYYYDNKKSEGLENKKVILDIGRRILAYEMATSIKEIPPIGYNFEPDVTEFIAEFNKMKEEKGIQVSLNTILMRCVIEGLKASPILNSRLDYKYRSARGTLTMCDHVDINMPTILPDGSMQALNIKNADKMNLVELDNYIQYLLSKVDDYITFSQSQIDLSFDQTMNFMAHGKIFSAISRLFWAIFGKERILIKPYISALEFRLVSKKHIKGIDKSKAITKRDLEEGTVMISNIGSLYKGLKGNLTMFEIIPPEVFGVGINNLQRRAEVFQNENKEEEVCIRTILPIALVMDHKACDFGDIIPFIKRLDEIFAKPKEIWDW